MLRVPLLVHTEAVGVEDPKNVRQEVQAATTWEAGASAP